MQPLEECPLRQVPVVLDPHRQPLAGGLERLARGAPHDAWHAVPIWHPGQLEAQKGDALLHAGVKTTAPPTTAVNSFRILCPPQPSILQPPGGTHVALPNAR